MNTRSKNPVRREAPPPSRWLRNRTGTTHARLRKVAHRDAQGRKLYRLGFLGHGETPVWSHQEWTLDALVEAGVKFLKRAPSAKAVKS